MDESRDQIAAVVAHSPLFGILPPESRKLVAERLERISIESGEWLMRKGDPGDALFLVETGRLEVVMGDVPSDDPFTEGLEILRVLGPDSTVGELALVTGNSRSASVRASRDSSLLKLSSQQFHDLIASVPAFTEALVSALGQQLQASGGLPGDIPAAKTFAIVPSVEGIDMAQIGTEIEQELSNLGNVAVLDSSEIDKDDPVTWGLLLDEFERRFDQVILLAECSEGEWRNFCVRQSDRRVCLVPAEQPPQGRDMPRLQGGDIVFLGDGQTPEISAAWMELLSPKRTFRVRSGAHRSEDLKRVIRRLTGQSLGLVLGGGGARGFAHLGVLEVLEENGIEIDRIGGTSMGGMVAATYACGLDAEERRSAVAEVFSRRNRHRYQVPPRSAVAKLDRTISSLGRIFGGQVIELLPIDLFTVSSDLVGAKMCVDRRGPVADAALASVSLPAMIPPTRRPGQLLVDGGLMRNLPIDVMAFTEEGPVVAVDVGGRFEPREGEDGLPMHPKVGETLMRSVMLGSAAAGEEVAPMAELVLEPDVADLSMLAFGEMDIAVERGREAARASLARISSLS